MAHPFKISLNNFRAFAETDQVSIRPLTLLVGENSTGKTSFLSALRFAFDLKNIKTESYFNEYPFELGSYEDIAHDSINGKTSDRFSVSIEKQIDINKSLIFRINSLEHENVIYAKMTFFFKSYFGYVVVSSIELQLEQGQLNFHFSEEGNVFIKSEDDIINLSGRQRDLFSNITGTKYINNITSALYFLMDFRFGRENPDWTPAQRKLVELFSSAFDSFINTEYSIVCSPPVRSVPRSVYTRSDDSGTKEPSNAPHELNRLKRADRRRWNKLHSGLSRFGKLSGLFTRFDIKKLTAHDSGPFQVKVMVRGRSSTIADVGYGVSQALPIMTDILEAGSKPTAFLLQQPEVHLHPKAQASLGTMFSEFISKNSKGYIIAETHSDYLVDRIRIDVREGRLNCHNVNIIYFHAGENSIEIHEISIDKQGNLTNCPDGYRDFFIREQERVLGF